MKSTTPVFEKLELTYVVREMRRMGGRVDLEERLFFLIKNRIYPFRLLMKRKLGSVSRPSCLIQMMKLKFLIKIGIKD